jgi:hypothetical protein
MRRIICRQVVAIVWMCLTVSMALAMDPTPSSSDALKADAIKAATRLRGLHSYDPGGCDVNALLGAQGITRSREPLLHSGDRVVAVNGHVLDSTESPFKLVNDVPVPGMVRFGLVRKNIHLTVTVACMDSRPGQSMLLLALDAAAAGNFADCAQKLYDHDQKFVQTSWMYAFRRRCSVAAGLVAGDQISATLLTYWTLRLEELKYQPEHVNEVRPFYLTAIDHLVKDDKTVLADELRRQWAMATGERPMAVPGPSAAARPIAPRAVASYPVRRRTYGSFCEDGHFIEEVMGDGAVIKLEDGTLWRVDDADTADSALWLPSTSVIVCDGKLINTDDNESVEVEQVR